MRTLKKAYLSLLVASTLFAASFSWASVSNFTISDVFSDTDADNKGTQCNCQYTSGAKGVYQNGDCKLINCWYII